MRRCLLISIPDSEYKERIKKVQERMVKDDIDLLVVYSSECESANVRYLADFWPTFDFAGVLVPREGEAALLTGGPESLEFARKFSRIKWIMIHPGFVETSAPDWLTKHETRNFSTIIPEVCGGLKIRKVGIAGANIFPHVLYVDLQQAIGEAKIVNADHVMFDVRKIKSYMEIKLLEEAYRITEEAMEAAVDYAEVGKTEQQITAEALATMYKLGAEGTSYSIWVASGPNTALSLYRPTNRAINENELVQLTFGAKYQGYCGNMCRGMVFGELPESVRRLVDIAIESEEKVIEMVAPGVKGIEVYKMFSKILAKYGLEKGALYGPAHGTGLQECEGPWLDAKSDWPLQPNMVFNIDIWLSDGKSGIRYEDGIVITDRGVKELTSWRRELIRK
jgi:Xaa-Pro aminopeptidase